MEKDSHKSSNISSHRDNTKSLQRRSSSDKDLLDINPIEPMKAGVVKKKSFENYKHQNSEPLLIGRPLQYAMMKDSYKQRFFKPLKMNQL